MSLTKARIPGMSLIQSSLSSTRYPYIHNPVSGGHGGSVLYTVDTPSLILSLPAVKRNLTNLRNQLSNYPHIHLRPHVKTHKCLEICELQLRKHSISHDSFSGGGAVGLCFQILDELQPVVDDISSDNSIFTLSNHGNPALPNSMIDLLVTNQIVGPMKLNRLQSMASSVKSSALISVLVDDLTNLRHISDLASKTNTTFGVFVEVNAGQQRCGVAADDGELIVALAETIRQNPMLMFRGIHCYQGMLQHVRSREERLSLVLSQPVHAASLACSHLRTAGIPVDIITGGGTGTYMYEVQGGIHNEVQPGSYVLMDGDYDDNEQSEDDLKFENALWIHSTVVSTAVQSTREKQVVVDVGTKGVDLTSGAPHMTLQSVKHGFNGSRLPSVTYTCGGDEHGVLTAVNAEASEILGKLQVGDTVRLIPRHIDPTVNMYQWFVVVDDEVSFGSESGPVVSSIWGIHGRSPGY